MPQQPTNDINEKKLYLPALRNFGFLGDSPLAIRWPLDIADSSPCGMDPVGFRGRGSGLDGARRVSTCEEGLTSEATGLASTLEVPRSTATVQTRIKYRIAIVKE